MKKSWIITIGPFALALIVALILINSGPANPDQGAAHPAAREPAGGKAASFPGTLLSDAAENIRRFLFFRGQRIIPGPASPAGLLADAPVSFKAALPGPECVSMTLAEQSGREAQVFIGENSALAAGRGDLCFIYSPFDRPAGNWSLPRLPFSPYHHLADRRPYYLVNAADYDLTTGLSRPLVTTSEGQALELDGCFPETARQVWIFSQGAS